LRASRDGDFLPVVRDGLDAERAVESLASANPNRRVPVLFESVESGEGRQPDWDRAARLAQRVRLVLAGGLTAENVADAIARVRPYAVDVSTGVEARRGVKDPAKIVAFLSAVRDAERALQGAQ
jgi:phosphoribosylanthranilate isomerase